MKFSVVIIMLMLSIGISMGQMPINASDLLDKSIKYHDPKGKLLNSDLTFNLIETRPNGADRETTINCNIQDEVFTSIQKKDSLHIVGRYTKGKVEFKVNGSGDISNEIKKEHRLNEKRFNMLRNYYQYLWLLPVKLEDEGTILDPIVKQADFFGKDALQVKVTYDPKVGHDIWYFYFHPESYAMIGYRFYHDEAANDGEYILLDGETTYGKIRLPKERKWYMHKDDKYLGSDILDVLTVK